MDTLYYDGRRLVYVDTGDTHLVVDAQWERYLEVRVKIPKLVECFDSARKVIMKLSGDKPINQPKTAIHVVLSDTVEPADRLLVDERWDGGRVI